MGKKNRRGQVKIKLKYQNISYKDGDFFEVEEIKDKRIIATGEIEYFVKWVGWPEETNTWEPKDHLKNIRHLIMNYEQKISSENGTNFVEPVFSQSDSDFSLFSEPEGCLPNDIPMRIVKMFQEEDSSIKAEIEWMVRKSNGIKPLNSVIDRDSLKKSYLMMLVDYYETKFRWPKDQNFTSSHQFCNPHINLNQV